MFSEHTHTHMHIIMEMTMAMMLLQLEHKNRKYDTKSEETGHVTTQYLWDSVFVFDLVGPPEGLLARMLTIVQGLSINPKGPCTQIVYTLALKYSLYRYIEAKVYTIWVHGPLG